MPMRVYVGSQRIEIRAAAREIPTGRMVMPAHEQVRIDFGEIENVAVLDDFNGFRRRLDAGARQAGALQLQPHLTQHFGPGCVAGHRF